MRRSADAADTTTGLPAVPSSGAALPSPLARVLAFVAIAAAGICGGLIGYGITDLQSEGDGGTAAAIGGVIGALVAAVGVAIVAVLALRAMSEWRTIEERRANEAASSPSSTGQSRRR
jgi:predicted lipid-binding transport protein (Tim44 family)